MHANWRRNIFQASLHFRNFTIWKSQWQKFHMTTKCLHLNAFSIQRHFPFPISRWIDFGLRVQSIAFINIRSLPSAIGFSLTYTVSHILFHHSENWTMLCIPHIHISMQLFVYRCSTHAINGILLLHTKSARNCIENQTKTLVLVHGNIASIYFVCFETIWI